MSDLLQRMTDRLPALLHDVRVMVECESPSADLDRLAASADVVAGLAVVPVALAVAWYTHRLRHRLTAGIEPAAHAPLKSD